VEYENKLPVIQRDEKEATTMNRKTAGIAVLSIFMVLGVVFVVWRSASAATISENHIAFGKQGIFVPGGFSPENVSLDRIHPREFRGRSVSFKRPLMDLAFRDNDGRQVSIPFAMTYIYYELSRSEKKQWDKGNLSIYYQDVTTGVWTKCNSVPVNSGSGEEVSTTLACVAPQATLFGLGRTGSE
jgi:hypothetical protein